MAFESADIQFDSSESAPVAVDFKALEDAGIEIQHEDDPKAIDQTTIDSIDDYLAADLDEEELDHNPEIANLIESIKTQQVIEEKAGQRSIIEHIMSKLGYIDDGIESDFESRIDDTYNPNSVKPQDINTIITKHTYGGTREVKLVKMLPLAQTDLENEGLTDMKDIGEDLNKQMYMVFVKDIEGAQADKDADMGYSEDQSMRIDNYQNGGNNTLKKAA